MSRSYRKTPVVTLQQKRGQNARKTVSKSKRKANRRVRISEDVPDGKAYRKYSNSWDICDYKSYWPNMPDKYKRK